MDGGRRSKKRGNKRSSFQSNMEGSEVDRAATSCIRAMLIINLRVHTNGRKHNLSAWCGSNSFRLLCPPIGLKGAPAESQPEPGSSVENLGHVERGCDLRDFGTFCNFCKNQTSWRMPARCSSIFQCEVLIRNEQCKMDKSDQERAQKA